MLVVFSKVHCAFKCKDGDIIVKVAWIVFRMNGDRGYVFLYERIQFVFVFDVRFTQTHFQAIGSFPCNAVSSSEDV